MFPKTVFVRSEIVACVAPSRRFARCLSPSLLLCVCFTSLQQPWDFMKFALQLFAVFQMEQEVSFYFDTAEEASDTRLAVASSVGTSSTPRPLSDSSVSRLQSTQSVQQVATAKPLANSCCTTTVCAPRDSVSARLALLIALVCIVSCVAISVTVFVIDRQDMEVCACFLFILIGFLQNETCDRTAELARTMSNELDTTIAERFREAKIMGVMTDVRRAFTPGGAANAHQLVDMLQSEYTQYAWIGLSSEQKMLHFALLTIAACRFERNCDCKHWQLASRCEYHR